MTINTENAGFSYNNKEKGDNKKIFSNVNICLNSGNIMAILGPNGSGKTTFLKCLRGMLKWTEGKSLFDGRDTNSFSSREFWDKVSYVPQQRTAASGFTAFETVLLGRSGQVAFFGTPKKVTSKRLKKLWRSWGS